LAITASGEYQQPSQQLDLYVDVGLKTDFILSFNAVLVFSLLYIGLLTMDDDEPHRMMMMIIIIIIIKGI